MLFSIEVLSPICKRFYGTSFKIENFHFCSRCSEGWMNVQLIEKDMLIAQTSRLVEFSSSLISIFGT